MSGWRWGTVIVALLALAELGVRHHFSTLPSLAALERAEPFEGTGHHIVVPDGPDPEGCLPGPATDQSAELRFAWKRRLGPSEGEPLRFYVVGDSQVFAPGVPPEASFAFGLAETLQLSTERPVELVNLGFQAAGFCDYLQELHLHLDRAPLPDVVLLNVFADDLEQRALVLVEGEVAIDPSWVAFPGVPFLLRQSWLLNWSWWQAARIAVQRSKDAPYKAPTRWVEPAAQENFKRAWRTLSARSEQDGFATVVSLLAPSGASLCPDNPTEDSECGWMKADAELMAQMLFEASVVFTDLRSLSEEPVLAVLPSELASYRQTGALPVHLDALGHSRVVERLNRAVLSAYWHRQGRDRE